MDRRTAYSRRLVRGSQNKTRLAVLAMFGVAGCAVLLLLLLLREPDLIRAAAAGEAVTAPATPAALSASAPPATTTARRIYPYSIIPGGVSGRDELARVIKTDKVVAAHYASFNVNKAKELIVSKPRAVYVSYRKSDKVYWTARKVKLAAGETLLSDGQTEMRARCANRISDVPQEPVEPDGPGEEELDAAFEDAQNLLEEGASSDSDPNITGFAGQAHPLFGFAHGAGQASPGGATLSSSNRGQRASAGSSGGNPPAPGVQYSTATMLRGLSRSGNSAPGNPAEPPAAAAPSPVADESTGGPGGSLTSADGPELAALPPALEPPTRSPESPPSSELPGAMSAPRPSGDQSAGEESGERPPRPSPSDETKVASPGPGTELEELALIPGAPLGPPGLPVSIGDEVPKTGEVPEPGTLWLSGAAFAAMLLLRRKGGRRKG